MRPIVLSTFGQVKNRHLNLFFLSLLDNNNTVQDDAIKKSSGEYQSAAVASENPHCSMIGKDILREGGNAVDAAISTLLCIGIINNFSSGIGG